MSNSRTSVTVSISDHVGELEIINNTLDVIERGFGTLNAELSPGVYKVRARAGYVVSEKIFAVDAEASPLILRLRPLGFTSPVPMAMGTSWSPNHIRAIYDSIQRPLKIGLGRGSTILLSIRNSSYDRPLLRSTAEHSFTGFRLRNGDGELLLDLDDKIVRESDLEFGVVNMHVDFDLEYNVVLTYEPNTDESFSTAIPIRPHWQTQIFVEMVSSEDFEVSSRVRPNLVDRAVVLVPMDEYFDAAGYRLIEVARFALMRGRAVFTPRELARMQKNKFGQNPILGLLIAYGLLVNRKYEDLHEIVKALEEIFGPSFPDVLTLRLALAGPKNLAASVRKLKPTFLPLLRCSWEIVDHHWDFLAEKSMMRKVAPRIIPEGLWLAWKPLTDDDVAREELGLCLRAFDLFQATPQGQDTMRSLARKLNLGFYSHDITALHRSFLRTFDDGMRGSLHQTMISLARKLKLVRSPSHDLASSETKHSAFYQLTALQRSLLLTLQLIRSQLDNGRTFSSEDLYELCGGLKLPLPLLHKSLLDLQTIVSLNEQPVSWGNHRLTIPEEKPEEQAVIEFGKTDEDEGGLQPAYVRPSRP